MAHLGPHVEGKHVAHQRDVVVRRQQHPVALFRHAQQGHLHVVTRFVACLDGVLLLSEAERAVATKLDTDESVVVGGLVVVVVQRAIVVVDHLHRAFHLSIGVDGRLSGDDENGKGRRQLGIALLVAGLGVVGLDHRISRATHARRSRRAGGDEELVQSGTILSATDGQCVLSGSEAACPQLFPLPRAVGAQTIDIGELSLIHLQPVAIVVPGGAIHAPIDIIGAGRRDLEAHHHQVGAVGRSSVHNVAVGFQVVPV